MQHGFTVKESADPWAPPKLPPLHQHRLADRSHALTDSFLTRADFGSQYPATPQQLHALRPLAASHTHGSHNRAHHSHSHDKLDGTLQEDDSFGIKKLVSICASGSFSPTIPACLNGSQPEPHLEVVGTVHASPDVRRLVRAVARGLRCCQEPQAAEAGLGGTYFFRSEAGAMVAIIKPCDEEPLAPNNPKGFVGRQLGEAGLKPTVRVGEAALREVAAFLLDHDGFAKVPPTVLVRCFHPIFHTNSSKSVSHTSLKQLAGSSDDSKEEEPLGKLGSLQEFVAHDGDTSEVGASRFAAADVRRIGILDIRLFNTDRHAGNMLVVPPHRSALGGRSGGGGGSALARLAETRCGLRPIDHGFCLPEALEPPYLEWLHWPQAMMPFTSEELAYIAALDATADCELLARELPALRPECGRTLQVATTLLQRAAAAGRSLAEIGNVVSRPLVGMDEEASPLEHLCIAARAAVDAAAAEGNDSDGNSTSAISSSDGTASPSDSNDEFQLSDTSDDDEIGSSWAASFPRASAAPPRRHTFAHLGTVLTCGTSEAAPPLGQTALQAAVVIPRGGHISSANADAPGWQPATMLSDILSDDEEAQLPPLPPEWEQQAEAASEGALKGGGPGVIPGQGGPAGGLSAAFSSAASDVAQLSLTQLPCDGSKRLTAAADAAQDPQRSSPSAANVRTGTVSPHTPGAALPRCRPPHSFGHAPQSPSDSLSSIGAFSQPPSPLRGLGSAATGEGQLARQPRPKPVRTSYSGDYCPYGAAAPGASSGEMGANTFGGRTLASSGSDSPIFHQGLEAGGHTFGGHTHSGRPGRHFMHRVGSAAAAGSHGGGDQGGIGRGTASVAVPLTMLRGVSGDGGGGAHRRHAIGDATPHRSRRNGHRPKARQHHVSAYPPPIEGRKPEAVNALFSGLSPQQWSDFMQHLSCGIEAALACGQWRSDRRREQSGAPIGASCPRF